MYSSERGHNIAIHPGRRVAEEGADREGFRPVALPALAAAVHVAAQSVQAAREKIAGTAQRRFVHEDEPSD